MRPFSTNIPYTFHQPYLVNDPKNKKMVFTFFNMYTQHFLLNETKPAKPKNGHHVYQAVNEMSCMQTSFTNVNLFSD